MKLQDRDLDFWKWMSQKGYAKLSPEKLPEKPEIKNNQINYPYSYLNIFGKEEFTRQALIGYLMEYCLERGIKISYYYLTDLKIDAIYRLLVDLSIKSSKISLFCMVFWKDIAPL